MKRQSKPYSCAWYLRFEVASAALLAVKRHTDAHTHTTRRSAQHRRRNRGVERIPRSGSHLCLLALLSPSPSPRRRLSSACRHSSTMHSVSTSNTSGNARGSRLNATDYVHLLWIQRSDQRRAWTSCSPHTQPCPILTHDTRHTTRARAHVTVDEASHGASNGADREGSPSRDQSSETWCHLHMQRASEHQQSRAKRWQLTGPEVDQPLPCKHQSKGQVSCCGAARSERSLRRE